uniref:NUDIX domain-containing protein n=1 Tax=Acetatifactor sp. TaxID=1872090 RepID=UPI00405788F4
MIHVNVRGLLVREYEGETQMIIQLRKREGEPEVYELPGGRINEYEKITDALKREVMEETGLKVVAIHNEKDAITTDFDSKSSFSVECIKPFVTYQTIEGPVDSFGICFICEVEGELLTEGDDTTDIHWASIEEIREMIDRHRFSEIDLPAVLMFLKSRI